MIRSKHTNKKDRTHMASTRKSSDTNKLKHYYNKTTIEQTIDCLETEVQKLNDLFSAINEKEKAEEDSSSSSSSGVSIQTLFFNLIEDLNEQRNQLKQTDIGVTNYDGTIATQDHMTLVLAITYNRLNDIAAFIYQFIESSSLEQSKELKQLHMLSQYYLKRAQIPIDLYFSQNECNSQFNGQNTETNGKTIEEIAKRLQTDPSFLYSRKLSIMCVKKPSTDGERIASCAINNRTLTSHSFADVAPKRLVALLPTQAQLNYVDELKPLTKKERNSGRNSPASVSRNRSNSTPLPFNCFDDIDLAEKNGRRSPSMSSPDNRSTSSPFNLNPDNNDSVSIKSETSTPSPSFISISSNMSTMMHSSTEDTSTTSSQLTPTEKENKDGSTPLSSNASTLSFFTKDIKVTKGSPGRVMTVRNSQENSSYTVTVVRPIFRKALFDG